MKKILYTAIAGVLITFYACGGNQSNDSQVENETESHEGHDHAAMEEAAMTNAFKAANENANVFFTNLKEGDKVSSPVKVVMGVEGMTVHPAGEIIEGTGHHHIIIDGNPVTSEAVVPADEKHIHFGGGQTETEVELTPGNHTLTLQFADGLHRSYGEQMSATINIVVE